MSPFPVLIVLPLFALWMERPIDLSVFPRHVLRAPAELRVRLTTPRHPDNRWICWQYDGPEYKQFCWEAKGELAPRTETFWWYVRHEGEYEALAIVIRSEEGHQRRYLARSSFRVGTRAARACITCEGLTGSEIRSVPPF